MSSRSHGRRLRRVVQGTAALAVGAVLALSGCAAGGPSDSGEDDGVLTVALPGSLASLYVGQETGVLNYYVAALSQEGLVAVDPTGNLAPALAESWEQPDATTYVYRIRQDAVFQDGTPVTVDDIVYSIEQSTDPEVSPQFSWWYSNLAGVEQTGEWEITLTLAEPDVGFAWIPSASAGLFVAPRAFWEEYDGAIGTTESLLVGSGPYRVTEFVPDSHIALEAVDSWWGGVPEITDVRLEVIPDENTRLLALQSGEVDFAFNVPLQQVAQWDDSEGVSVQLVPNRSYEGLTFDTSVAPFDDPHVRNAIAHSLDKEAIAEKVYSGHAEVATAILTPSQLETVFSPEEARDVLGGITQYDFDLAKAQEELAASTVPDGFELELTYPNTVPELGLVGQSLAQNLAEIGITLTVTELPISSWMGTLQDGVHGLSFMSYNSTTGDPAELTAWFLGADNPASYDNPAVTAAIDAARVEVDLASRIELLVESNRLQAVDNAYLPIVWGVRATASSDAIAFEDSETFTFVTPWAARVSLVP